MSDNLDRESTFRAETKDTLQLTWTLLLQAGLLFLGLGIAVIIEIVKRHWNLSGPSFFIAEGVTAAAFVVIYSYRLTTHALKMMKPPEPSGWPKVLALILGVLVPLSGLVLSMSGGKRLTWGADTNVPLVLMGSDNVRSVIWSRVEPLKPIWVDVGSGSGLRNIFPAFYYGKNTPLGETRFGLSALSSDGIDALLKLIDEAKLKQTHAPTQTTESDPMSQNHFLHIRVAARVPLAFLYKGAQSNGLPELLTAKDVPEATEPQIARYVRKSDLDKFFSVPNGNAVRYVPEPETGTRKRFDPDGKFRWLSKNTRRYERCVEQFPDSFGELVTAGPFLCSPHEHAVTCDDMKAKHIFAAAVCLKDCAELQRQDFSVVIKIEKLQEGRYLITNPAERQLAHLLSPDIINKQGLIFATTQGVREDEGNNIVTIDALIPNAYEYLSCKPD
jgi:hypothetical protein